MNHNEANLNSANVLNGSRLADRAAAARAVQMALPLIENAMRDPNVGDGGFLHIVVMDPALTPADCSFEEAILFEHSIGDRAKWDADYAAFARAKAKLSWTSGLDSHVVQTRRPHLLREQDTTLWGSVVVDGIVVATSGVHPWYDEAFSGAIAMCLRAIVKDVRDRGVKGLFLD